MVHLDIAVDESSTVEVDEPQDHFRGDGARLLLAESVVAPQVGDGREQVPAAQELHGEEDSRRGFEREVAANQERRRRSLREDREFTSLAVRLGGCLLADALEGKEAA